MDHDVYVIRSAGVETRKQGSKLSNTIQIRLLYTTQKGIVEVGAVGGVSVAICHDARIDARGVAMPDFHVNIRNWLTGINVNNLVVKCDVDAFLAFANVLSNVLAADV
jgi:hypothetical protein